MGRPSDYSPALEILICERIAAGESLSSICRDDNMPSRETVYSWKAANQAFSDRYARAVEDRAEKLAEEILDIADEKTGDYELKNGVMAFNSENVARSRLKVDSRKWIASKLFPRKYGDKVQNEVTGPEGGPVQFAVKVTLVRPNAPST